MKTCTFAKLSVMDGYLFRYKSTMFEACNVIGKTLFNVLLFLMSKQGLQIKTD